MTCPNCGKEVSKESFFCTNCGAKLVEQNTSHDTAASIYNNKSHSRIISILQYGSFIIAFVSFCIVLYATQEGMIDIISTFIYFISIFVFTLFFFSISIIIERLEDINFSICKYKNKN